MNPPGRTAARDICRCEVCAMPDNTTLLLIGQQIKRGYDAMCREVGQQYCLTRNEIDVLLFLFNNPGRDTARDIVELRALTKSHVSKTVDDLTRRGFLAGTQDLRDRRCIHLRLLPAAAPAVDACRKMQRRFLDALYEGVTQEERAVLERVFQKIVSNLRGGASHGC